MDLVQQFVQEEQGQNVVEYALVLTLVAVAAITGLTIAGANINNWWTQIGNYINQLTTSIP